MLYDGQQVSTHDLTPVGGFALLVTDTDWWPAARSLTQEAGIPIAVARVGPAGDYLDVDGNWARLREVTGEGAVLVRPEKLRGLAVDYRGAGRLGSTPGRVREHLRHHARVGAPAAVHLGGHPMITEQSVHARGARTHVLTAGPDHAPTVVLLRDGAGEPAPT